jgi:ABC-type branched-subunit amino acid transport system permease subunit
MSPEDSISVFSSPDMIRILVAGGAGNQMGILTGASIHRRITKKVKLPADWDKLVKKYRDIAPGYVK